MVSGRPTLIGAACFKSEQTIVLKSNKMLTQADIDQLNQSRAVLRHVIDDEPANKKLGGWEILLWSLDELTAILIRNGKYQKPRLFGYFRLAKFAIELIKRINQALKEKHRAKPIQQ